MKSILFLKKTSQQLPDIERYLESRGFKITVMTEIREAIQFITDQRPDFALMSTDLIPQRSLWLFGVLHQLTQVILFADRISAKNLAVSIELKGTYLLEPPLTPLGFEQILRRVERENRKHVVEVSHLDKTHVWIMSALADLALKALCKPTSSGTPAEVVSRVTKVTCFRMQTTKLAGYFILAYGQNRKLENSWMSKLQDQLKQFLASFEDNLVIEDSDELIIEEVQFNEWSRDQANFIRQATHEEAELVLAFFKDPTQMQIQPSLQNDCVEVGIEHIQGDRVVNFDVYIYLPQNARFVLYTPRGSTFYEDQKKKLVNDGVRSVHIHKRSLDEVRRHRARSFIENSAASFHPSL